MAGEPALAVKASRTIEEHGMLSRGDRVLVSVSGGADSVALLLFLYGLARSMELELLAFHLDHMLRAEESAADAGFVHGLCGKLGIPVTVEVVDVASLRRASGGSPQDVARKARLERLMACAETANADRIAVGHTADDQVETFLIRVVQGAGLDGLSGIPPVSGKVTRPLIEVWRSEVEEYCRWVGVEPRRDPSNLDTAYLRNRVRHELVPALVTHFGPGVKEVILREVENLAVDREFLRGRVGEAFSRTATVEGRQVRLDLDGLSSLHPALQRGVIRESWSRLLPGEPPPPQRVVMDVLSKIAGGRSGASLELPRGVVAQREYGVLVLRISGGPMPRPTAVLEDFGRVRIAGTGLVLEARLVDAGEVEFTDDGAVEFVRADIEFPLEVRPPRAGDRFRPLGAPGTTKLSDFFIDGKVTRKERARAVLLLSGGRIVWVVGHRIAEDFRLGPTDEKAVRLRALPADEYD